MSTALLSAPSRACAECGADLSGKRSNAIFCTRRCKVKASDRRRREDGRARVRDHARYPAEAENRRAYARKQTAQLRDQTVDHYGGECIRCGAGADLELDHVHGNGEAHRDRVGHGDAFRRWLIHEDFPSESGLGGEFELQVLCSPCHRIKTKAEREAKGRG
jgi:hypothetical protein